MSPAARVSTAGCAGTAGCSESARPHTPANPAAAMARPTATIVLACRGTTHTAFADRRARAAAPPAARTAGRARPTGPTRHGGRHTLSPGLGAPGTRRGQRGGEPRAARGEGNPARRRRLHRGAESGASGLCGALTPRPRPSRARGPREPPGRARPAPLTHHVRPQRGPARPPQPPQTAAAAVKRGAGTAPGTAQEWAGPEGTGRGQSLRGGDRI